MILRTLYDEMLEQGKDLYVTFIDYSAAFDSVSHKFLDRALKKAGASAKSRALFRAIYKAASATTRVDDVDGKTVTSAPFQVNRGVIQGDITSPLYFILALELILRRHDAVAEKGTEFGGRNLHTLGYADDAALIDTDLHVATTRVTSIATGSKRDADMEISISKTEVMQVREQGRIAPATPAEAAAVCTYTCPHLGCGKVFYNMHGCKCHAGKCRWQQEYEVDRILAVKGTTAQRKYLVRWKGYGPEYDLWLPHNNLHPDLINEFLLANGLYDHNWTGVRCPECDKPCASERGVKLHKRHCQMQPETQNFDGTCAVKRVRDDKLEAKQKRLRGKVLCEGKELKNVFRFKYLGAIFSANGDQTYDIKRRISLAMTRMGQLRHVFNSKIGFGLKMRVYKTAICSLFTYGSEAWTMNKQAKAMLNGANARCLSRFTGKDAHQEASVRTRSYDLVTAVMLRRRKWLGHILRMGDERLVKLAAGVQHDREVEDNLFAGTPAGMSYADLVGLAGDRVAWKGLPL